MSARLRVRFSCSEKKGFVTDQDARRAASDARRRAPSIAMTEGGAT